VAFFVREMIQSYPNMHSSLLTQLRDTFHQLQSARVCTTVLWVLAEYSKETEEITSAMNVILDSMGLVPFTKDSGVCHIYIVSCNWEAVITHGVATTSLLHGTCWKTLKVGKYAVQGCQTCCEPEP
jgi:hypothetical protein